MPVTLPVRATTRVPLVQVVKTAVAVVASWLIASAALPGTVPIFAVVAAIIVVQPSVNQSYARAVERSFGVVLGVLIALGAVLLLGQHSWLVLVATVIAVFASWALRLTPGSSSQIAISAMLVLTIGAATPEYALARIIETVMGAAIALIINAVIVPPVAVAPVRSAVARLARAEADRMDDLADLLTSDPDEQELDAGLTRARELRELRTTAVDAVTQGLESLAFTPRQARPREQLVRDRALLERLDPLVNRIIGMTRTTRDRWDAALVDEPLLDGIAEELRRAAHDLRLLVRHEEAAGRPRRSGAVPPPDVSGDGDELPALTRPLTLPAPDPTHWVLLGALLEDLRRIREEIIGD
ncbi:MAG: FUSC family protein [Naasia sp.]